MKVKLPVLVFIAGILFPAAFVSTLDAAPGITVKTSADTITITGDKGKKVSSDKFALSKDGWYIMKISYTGADVSSCQLSLATEAMVAKKDTVGGLLTNWIGPNTTEKIQTKGSLKSEDYVIYVDAAEGPWTVEISINPKPSPVSSDTTFSGTSDKATPFFPLKKGPATFTMNQKLKGAFAARLAVVLVNADTGAYVSALCHNSTNPKLTAKADIPADGNYILSVVGGGSWDVSFAQ